MKLCGGRNMAAFLDDVSPFIGTGERDEDGLTLEEFLEVYDSSKYENPCSTADIIVIRSQGKIEKIEQNLKVLMIKRRNHPGIGMWALPGGFAEVRENLIDSAKRELEEETALRDIAVEQMYTWGETWRDPRTRIITTSYLAVVNDQVQKVKAGDDAKDAIWMDIALKKIKEDFIIIGGKDRIEQIYEMELLHKEKILSLTSVIKVSFNREGVLKEKTYEVISNDGIAFDHPRFILQALLYIKEQI